MSALPTGGTPAAEPKDGDFVAYLADIERRQLAALPHAGRAAQRAMAQSQHMTAAPSADALLRKTTSSNDLPKALTAAEARALQAKLKSAAPAARSVALALVFGVSGLLLALHGALDGGGLVPLAIGVFLIWRAVKALRSAARPPGDLAARLAASLRTAQSSSRR